MARVFRSLSGSKNFRPWKEWEIGDYVVGKYERKEIDNYNKDNWVLKVEEVFFQNEAAEIKFGPGKMVGLNSNGSLDKVMNSGQIQFGDVIRVEYDGMSPMGKGTHEGKDAHSIIVSVCEGGSDNSGNVQDTNYQDGLSDDDGSQEDDGL